MRKYLLPILLIGFWSCEDDSGTVYINEPSYVELEWASFYWNYKDTAYVFGDTVITNDTISYMYKTSPINSDDNDNYDAIETCGWIKYYENENYLDYIERWFGNDHGDPDGNPIYSIDLNHKSILDFEYQILND